MNKYFANYGLWYYYKGMQYADNDDVDMVDFCVAEIKKRGLPNYTDLLVRLRDARRVKYADERREKHEEAVIECQRKKRTGSIHKAS